MTDSEEEYVTSPEYGSEHFSRILDFIGTESQSDTDYEVSQQLF